MLASSLQENVVSLLAFDDEYSSVIRNSIELKLYGGPFRLIASRCYDYIDRYKKAPKEHLADIMSDKLTDESAESKLYIDIVDNIYTAKENINREYVINQIQSFIKRQSLRSISVELTKRLQEDTEESLQQAYELISKSNVSNLSVFDSGTRLSDSKRSLKFLDISSETIPTGIPDLDKRGFGPTRKEMWLLIANAKRGKSWALMHLAKMALMSRYKVVHITLEMSEGRCAQRYFQALFAISKHADIPSTVKFKKDELGRVIEFDDVKLTPKMSLSDPNIRVKLEKLINQWSVRTLDNIIIKEFPTSTLTMQQLKAYLDNLETKEQFAPDLLIIDYPDLMKLNSDNMRLDIDKIYKELRGLAGERNIALAIVSQGNRSGEKSKKLGADQVAEAYSKIAHADVIITMTATEAEHNLGLARLHVAGGRNDVDKFTIVISQQYGLGSFVVDSCLMSSGYDKQFKLSETKDDT